MLVQVLVLVLWTSDDKEMPQQTIVRVWFDRKPGAPTLAETLHTTIDWGPSGEL